MNMRPVTNRGISGRLLMTFAAVAVFAAPVSAAPFQLLKTFDSALVGSATFEFTIETKVSGFWVEVPCIDNRGSCSLTFSNVAAGTSFVLADSSDAWFKEGQFFLQEVTPAGWRLDRVVGPGTSFLSFDPVQSEVYFDFSSTSEGYVELVNVPEPATLGMFGIGFAAALGRLRRRAFSRDRGIPPSE